MNQGKIVVAMATVRFVAASIEIVGACLMLYFWRLRPALKINTILGGIGPLFFLLASALGISATKPSVWQLSLLGSGLLLTFLGLR